MRSKLVLAIERERDVQVETAIACAVPTAEGNRVGIPEQLLGHARIQGIPDNCTFPLENTTHTTYLRGCQARDWRQV